MASAGCPAPAERLAPGRIERQSPDFQSGVLPIGRQGHLVATHGFEPRSSESKSGVLPLDDMALLVAGGGVEPPTSGFRDRRSATELTRTAWGDRWESNPCFRSHKPASWPLDDGPHVLGESARFERVPHSRLGRFTALFSTTHCTISPSLTAGTALSHTSRRRSVEEILEDLVRAEGVEPSASRVSDGCSDHRAARACFRHGYSVVIEPKRSEPLGWFPEARR